MNLKGLFHKKERAVTVDQILDQDQVKRVALDFVEKNLPTAQAIIIIWATPEGDVKVCLGGGIPNECTALGVLRYAEHIIVNEGMEE